MSLKRLLLILCVITLSSCGKEDQVSIITEQDVELQMIEAYEKGKKALDEGDVLYAAKMLWMLNYYILSQTGRQNLH